MNMKTVKYKRIIGLFCAAAILIPVLSAVLYAAFGLMLGLKFANLTWTNEIYPIKQSLSVLLYMLLGMAYGAAVIGLYFLGGMDLGAQLYLKPSPGRDSQKSLGCGGRDARGREG